MTRKMKKLIRKVKANKAKRAQPKSMKRTVTDADAKAAIAGCFATGASGTVGVDNAENILQALRDVGYLTAIE